MKKRPAGGVVYSTETGRSCPGCKQPVQQCCCRTKKKHFSGNSTDGVVRVSRQTKGRKGSGVCLVSGLTLDEAALKKLAKLLKQKCASGGAVKNGIIEIQGDHRQILVKVLSELGYTVKSAGG